MAIHNSNNLLCSYKSCECNNIACRKIYDSFNDAKMACDLIFLKPGESHVEYYKTDNQYHCVVAIGNIVPNISHLYITDTGDDKPILEKLKEIQDLAVDAYQLSQYVDQQLQVLNTSLNVIADDINNINSSILEIKQKNSSFYPVENSSIESLFHNDIYTVNLCCYSQGGYINVYDNIAGYEQGGDSSRVAPCTPFNEYKTYVLGDQITLEAVPRFGHYFKKWLVDADLFNPIYDVSINLTFNEERKDINAISTLNNGQEPAPLRNGYTAIFQKMRKITYDVSLLNLDVADFADDKLTFAGDIREQVDNIIYTEDNANIIVTAHPMNNRHMFKYYLIDSSIEVDQPSFTFTNINKDYQLSAVFEELRYDFFAEPNVASYGDVKHTYTLDGNPYSPKANTFIKDAIINLEACPAENYRFICWEYGEGEERKGDVYSTNSEISIVISKISPRHLVAKFVPFNSHIVTFMDDETRLGEIYVINGMTVNQTEGVPSIPERTGYDSEWVNDNIDFDTPITENTTFKTYYILK